MIQSRRQNYCMKRVCLLVGLLFCAHAGLYSQTVKIVSGQSSVNYLKSEPGGNSSVIKDIVVEVEFSSTAAASPFTCTFEITNVSNAAITGVATGTGSIVNVPVGGYIINASEFGSTPKRKKFEVHVQLNAVSGINSQQFFDIQLTGQTAGSDPKHTVNVEYKKTEEKPNAYKYDSSKAFWLETGGNLDLVDGLKVNNLAAGIFFHKIDNIFGRGGKWKWSLFAGIYESKIISQETNLFEYKPYITPASVVSGSGGNATLYNYWGAPKKITTARNWSFFASPQVRLTNANGSADDGHFHLFASLWGELQYQEIVTTIDNSSLTAVGTTTIPINTINNYKQLTDTVTRLGVLAHYWGVGMPLYYSDNHVKLIFNPVVGATNQMTRDEYASLTGYRGNPCWTMFYLVQFRLSEKFLGITVTGEIRGLFKGNSPPAYTLALTKKFDLAKILAYP